mgnify:FL=1
MATNNFLGINNPFLGYLESEPAAAYYSSPRGSAFMGTAPARREYYQDQYQNVYNEFLGALGSQIRGGGVPTMKWTDYLEDYPFTERYAALSPTQAGRGTRQFSPRTRQLYY